MRKYFNAPGFVVRSLHNAARNKGHKRYNQLHYILYVLTLTGGRKSFVFPHNGYDVITSISAYAHWASGNISTEEYFDYWHWLDTREPVKGNPRACSHCDLMCADEAQAIDPCFSRPIEGVVNACCGHGNPMLAELTADDGVEVCIHKSPYTVEEAEQWIKGWQDLDLSEKEEPVEATS